MHRRMGSTHLMVNSILLAQHTHLRVIPVPRGLSRDTLVQRTRKQRGLNLAIRSLQAIHHHSLVCCDA